MTRYHATLTHRELEAQLKRQGRTFAEREQLLSDAKILRRQRASDAAFTRIHRDAWRALLTPLRQEWNNALVSAKYDPSDKLRVRAFTEYAEVLEHTRLRLLGRMMTMREVPMTFDEYTGNQTDMGEVLVWNADKTQVVKRLLASNELDDLRSAFEMNRPTKRRPFTPSELARYMTERYKRENKGFPVPNNGVHWVDWIAPALRYRVEELFAAWSERPDRSKHARHKEPFKRVDAPDKFDAKRERLYVMAEKDWERLVRLHALAEQSHLKRKALFEEDGGVLKENKKDLHVRLAARRDRAHKAMSLLQRWTREDGALPNTWHGVLPKE
jgi:hypothetical protein